MTATRTIGSGEVQTAIARIAVAISTRHHARGKLILLGIANNGIELARRLARELGAQVGVLDVSFHRDDFGRNPIPKDNAPTHLPTDIDGATVILVDSVLHSGRTIKAALDELFDHGRPARVELAVLVDRGGRRLPFVADYAGLTIPTTESETVVVSLDPSSPKRDVIRVVPAAKRPPAAGA